MIEQEHDILADILVDRQFLPRSEAIQWLNRARAEGCYLEEVLTRQDVFNRQKLLEILENNYFCPAVDPRGVSFNPNVLALLPKKLASRYMAFPVDFQDQAVQVAFAKPDDQKAREALSAVLRRQVIPLVALRDDLAKVIDQHYGRLSRELDQSHSTTPAGRHERLVQDGHSVQTAGFPQLELRGKSAPAIVDQLIETAAMQGASDIHLQPGEDDLVVRFRVDGILYTVCRLSKDLMASVTSRIKVMSKMDLAEHRLPQDGRHTIRKGNQIFDLRVSTLPSQFGEKVVIRLLTKNVSLLNLDNLRMPPGVYKAYQEVVNIPQGFFLVTGPTGSGKTTTLYATMNAIDRESVNVITLEDPIEYQLSKVTQVQINEDVGLTFASGLRSVLRQDPDIILVGEIRDVETVEIACRAALTGHKVFSTIHTNDTAQAITRLLDMGTPPYLITATLRGVLSQRLVRLICQECSEVYVANETELAILGYPKVKELKRGCGCAQCGGTGYKGRMAVFEYLRIEDNLHRFILDRASPYSIRHAALRNGMVLMADFAKRAVLEGLTTVPEIQRAVLTEQAREQLCQKCQRVVSIDFSVCPFCQQVLKEKCRGCGNPVESGWEACPNCGEEIEREWERRFCIHCLAPVEMSWSHCQYCGGQLHQ
ncbi:MAG: ATPase, T2SS/T4P/T4SS family [Acidobacteriota bacterium]